MADISNKEAIKRLDRAPGNGVLQTLLQTLFEIVIALLFALVLATILGVLTF